MSVDKRYRCDMCGCAPYGDKPRMIGFLHGETMIEFVDKYRSERHMCEDCLRALNVAIREVHKWRAILGDKDPPDDAAPSTYWEPLRTRSPRSEP